MKALVRLLPLLLVAVPGCAFRATDPPETTAEIEAARLMRAGKYEESLEAFKNAAAMDGRSYVSLLGVATSYAHLGNRSLFEMYAIQAAGAAPNTPKALQRIGTMYVQAAERFRRDPAHEMYARLGLEYLRRVYHVDPTRRDLAYNLGMAFYLSKRDREAVTVLEPARALEPRRLDVARVLLLSYRRLNQPAKALDVIRTVEAHGELPASWSKLRDWAAAGPGARRPDGPEEPR